ncbi:conserved hypothetical protein [Xenorhabdus cabanillasii JM26]|uniref:Uncharacterized protein n=1 Tax=Xenorhabdus cabanillasii JM26 TaxID=1427517 RepID=W1IP51_9GAMM|nr:conserved hypothetical protein [Xenorhabdus cabanillasii JM26]
MIRNTINISRLLAMPHSHEEKVKRAVDQMNSLTSPNRFANQPVTGMEMAFATPKEVMTHVPWEFDAPKFPAIVGMATLAMVESNTNMKVAIAREMVSSASFAPVSGSRVTMTSPYD